MVGVKMKDVKRSCFLKALFLGSLPFHTSEKHVFVG